MATSLGRALTTLVEVAGLCALVWWTGRKAGAFTGFPKGYDAMGHLSKATYIAENWPHIWWNYEWYSGQPTFTGSYPPGYHMLLVAVAKFANVPLPTAMNVVTFGALCLLVVGVYGTARAATGRRIAGLVAGALVAATPTVWSQNIVLGLYPRFTALAFAAPALGCAVRHAVRGGRLAALGTCVFLAASLGTHPIVGAIALVAVSGITVLQPAVPIGVRLVTTIAWWGVSLSMAGYFYLPLLLEKRSQSLFTDFEVPLNPRLLLGPWHGSIDALLPATLPAAALCAVLALRTCRPPRVSVAAKESLGVDVLALSDPDADLPTVGDRRIRRFLRWKRFQRELGYPTRLVVFFTALSLPFFGYGFVGYLDERFPYYINGLQPSDLLVYPAVCVALSLGIAIGIVVRLLGKPRATKGWPRVLGRAAGHLAIATIAAVVAVRAFAVTVPLLPQQAKTNDIPAQQARLAVFPKAADGQRQYRVAGVADSVTKWINEYWDAPQTRGYDDHGALFFDWQVWLEDALVDPAFSPAERDFLLDWYAVGWVDTDSGAGPTGMYDDPARFQLLAQDTRYAVLASYRYRAARPIVSVSRAPVVLFVGDTRHYDLFVRALSYADIGSTTVVPLQGPASLDDVTASDLRHADAVVLYGARIGKAGRDAALLRRYVEAGGRLLVDSADDADQVTKLLRAKANPLPVRAVHGTVIDGPDWGWRPLAPTLTEEMLANFGPASYAGTNQWAVSGALLLADWGRPLLTAERRTVLVGGRLGSGSVVWSGLGLPYHIDVFHSQAESRVLAKLLLGEEMSAPAATRSASAFSDAALRYRFVDPDRRVIDIDGRASGVLVKERWSPNWHATVDGTPTRIEIAGPGMMWIPLPDKGGSHHLVLSYRLSLVEIAGYGLAALTTTGVLLLLLVPPLWSWGRRRLEALVTVAARPVVGRFPSDVPDPPDAPPPVALQRDAAHRT
ncbi:MAG: hypothetical protein IRZ02_03410 [Acidothermus sp.]|nr:hypothetical protein [Acidothermus sp.]MCL6537690.1 hypothetical protein [Acidothermus sp.]